MSDSDTRSVSELEERIDTLGDPSADDEIDDDDRDSLADTLVALADAYGARGEFDAEAATIDRLANLRRDDADIPVHRRLAAALANATAVDDRDDIYETGIDPDRIERYRSRLESLYNESDEQHEHDENDGYASIAVQLARATARTAHAYGKAEQPDQIEQHLDRLEQLYDTHSETEIAAALGMGLAHGELYLEEPADRLDRVEQLYEAHPDGSVAAGLAGVIASRTNHDAEFEDVSTIEDRVARIESLAQRHPDADARADIERWLPVATANATRASFEIADDARIDYWTTQTNDYHDQIGSATSATWAAMATFYSARAAFFQGDIETAEQKLQQLRDLEAEYDNPVFEHWLGRCMFDAARGYAETGHYQNAREIADELETYAEGHPDREQIENGLDALRAQAPGLFDDSKPTPGVDDHACEDDACDHETETEAETETATERHTDTTTATTTETTERGTSTEMSIQELTEAIETLDRGQSQGNDTASPGHGHDHDHSGGSCQSGGCGSCGSDQALAEPASGPVLVGSVLTAGLIVTSVVYAAYRLLKVTLGAGN